MTIHYRLEDRRSPSADQADPSPLETSRRPARIASLIALAHRMEQLVGSGLIADYAELARLGHVTRARITQIMNLLSLAPDIQEYLLWLPSGSNPVKERDLRSITREVCWKRQRDVFTAILKQPQEGAQAPEEPRSDPSAGFTPSSNSPNLSDLPK